ncbi:netrin receptor unc-5-like [Anopheles funestus]|uniref:netrin receptor unc-5-like n=1 Tax=Anopheles funestus TaxID=62324 RepID=UPI0020C60F08|nr:netrin receptor unc-5-like [Anopheles funestus]
MTQVNMQDMANYTCVGENIAGKRVSEPSFINVYVDGGWSEWGAWTDCKCPGYPKQGKKRMRTCNNPEPVNNGASCKGLNTEYTNDCSLCSAGRWSSWSEWSECGQDCTQIRQRLCIGSSSTTQISSFGSPVTTAALPTNSSSGQAFAINNGTIISCAGKSQQSIKCSDGLCNNTTLGFIYLWVSLFAIVCIGAVLCIFKFIRKRKTIPTYSSDRTELQTKYFTYESKQMTQRNPDLTHNIGPIDYEYPLSEMHQRDHNLSKDHKRPRQTMLHFQHGSSLLTSEIDELGPLHPQNQLQQVPNDGFQPLLPLPRPNSDHYYDEPCIYNKSQLPNGSNSFSHFGSENIERN